MAAPPIKFVWLEAVRDQLCEDLPVNHTAILALATALVLHAKRDGSSIFPGQATMGRESGLRHGSTVRRALAYLVESGLLTHVRNRARGRREYSLTFPGDSRQMANERASDDASRVALSEHLEPESGRSDGHSDSHSLGHSLTTNPVTPSTREEAHQREARSSEANNETATGDVLWSTLSNSVKLRSLMSERGDSRESVQAAVRTIRDDPRWKDHRCDRCADGRSPSECPKLVVNAIVGAL